jgi:hypothetical protein
MAPIIMLLFWSELVYRLWGACVDVFVCMCGYICVHVLYLCACVDVLSLRLMRREDDRMLTHR